MRASERSNEKSERDGGESLHNEQTARWGIPCPVMRPGSYEAALFHNQYTGTPVSTPAMPSADRPG